MVIKWALTNACNLNCKHCFNADTRNPNDTISKKIVMDLINDMSQNYVKNIQFIGGEPILFEGIEEVIDLCSKLGISTWINTNGTLVNEQKAIKLINAELDTIIFSIDGPNAVTNDSVRGEGSFDKSVLAMAYFTRHNKKTNIEVNATLNRQGVLNLCKMAEFAINHPEVRLISIGLPDFTGNALLQSKDFWSDSDLFFREICKFSQMIFNLNLVDRFVLNAPPLFTHYLDKTYGTHFFKDEPYHCMGGSIVYFIDADGILYPCSLPNGMNYFLKKYSKPYLLEYCSIKRSSFSELYVKKEYLDFYQCVREHQRNLEIFLKNSNCDNCLYSLQGLCGNTCPINFEKRDGYKLCKIIQDIYINPLYKEEMNICNIY